MISRSQFRQLCDEKVLMLDGATGTELIKRGMPSGVAPELWVVEHPEAITVVQQAYAAAGSNIVYTPTFGGNVVKLAEFGLAGRAFELNKKLAEISIQAVRGQGVLVFGDMAPTGKFVEPSGDLFFEDAVDIFKQQAQALAAADVDGFVIETMMDLQEARAALIAVREVAPDAPVIVTLTFDTSRRTLTGCTPEAALITLQSLGADAFGCNCSTGPADMAELLEHIKCYAQIPLIAKPNAGLPMLKDGKTVFNMNAQMFAEYVPQLLAGGVNLLGGCCGTTPEHIAAAAAAVKKLAGTWHPMRGDASGIISSNRRIQPLRYNDCFTVIGERINPTGKKALQAELRNDSTALALQFALEQQAAGAQVLDINVGMPGIDEKDLMSRIVLQTTRAVELPLCIDSTSPEVVERALRIYPGRALLNSVSLEKERVEKVLPIAAQYGAMLILLPLQDSGLPEDCAGRIAVLNKLLTAVAQYGYNLQDVAVDALIMAVSAAPQAGNAALEFIDYCHNQLKVNTVCGLSNISFGLPNRMLVNRTFLTMAMARGLNMAIANPMNSDFMAAVLAAEAVNGKDVNMSKYLVAQSQNEGQMMVKAAPETADPGSRAYQAVLCGDAVSAVRAVEAALQDTQLNGREFLNNSLLRAIEEVGRKFEKKEYFLPQLLAGAEALQQAIAALEPALAEDNVGTDDREKIIIATVKGDIHDIGKNIVALMLRNSGFEVIDLGKDVAGEEIIACARREKCRLIGLSALMTTTMSEMPKIIELAAAEGLEADFIVGGAVVDQSFAESIGAAYAADAMMTVRLARELQARCKNRLND